MENHEKNILTYYTGHAAPNGVKPFYLIIKKINGYIDEHNGNKYLTLVHTDESTDALKKYEELRKKINDLMRSINNN